MVEMTVITVVSLLAYLGFELIRTGLTGGIMPLVVAGAGYYLLIAFTVWMYGWWRRYDH